MKKILSLLVLFTAARFGAEINPDLSQLQLRQEVSLRLKDDRVITGVQIVEIDAKSLTYTDSGLSTRVERPLVYRARQGDRFFSDLSLTSADHEVLNDYVSYAQARGDAIVASDGQTYIGKISNESESAFTIETRGATYVIQKKNITAWRRDGVSHGDVEAGVKPDAGGRDANDKKHLLDFSLVVSGPWGYLPAVNLGLATNANRLFYGGARLGAGYILNSQNSAGLHIQGVLFLNANLLTIGEYSRLYLGAGYLWRAGLATPLRGYSYSSSRSSDSMWGEFTQNTVELHIGLKYKRFLFEVGVEVPVSYVQSFRRPRTTTSTPNEIEAEIGNLSSSLNTFKDASRVHVLAAYLF